MIYFLLILAHCENQTQILETLYEWSNLEYIEDYEDYIMENNVLGNVRNYKNDFYVCVPRWRNGVPATLNILASSRDSRYLLGAFISLKKYI